MRAFVYEDEMPFERMWQQALRRLGFLKRKLIADLESGGKIFVYRLTGRNLDPPELERLHRAVRLYGDNTLLYVRYADTAHPNGTVKLAAPGLMIGYIDRFKMGPDGQLSASPPSASWLAICKNAYALFSAGSSAGAPAVASDGLPANEEKPISDEHQNVKPNGLFRPKLRDSDYREKRDGAIRELLRQRAFERLYRPHPASRVFDTHADLYDFAAETIGKHAPDDTGIWCCARRQHGDVRGALYQLGRTICRIRQLYWIAGSMAHA
jgi:hypothetical protein